MTRCPFPIIFKLDRNNGSCDVLTMDWLLNPNFLAALNRGSGGHGGGGRRRRRRDGEQCSHDDSRSEDGRSGEGDNDETAPPRAHRCAAEYDDLGFAPVRRTLPPPPPPARRGAQRPAAEPALLTCLRSFARREAVAAGAGVRLFVQAGVLSGCDYAPNRLAKVGPVNAFRLVQEAGHRAPEDRFARVLRGLPAGSVLVAPAGTGDGEDEDKRPEVGDGGGDDEDDFLSQPDPSRDAKAKYEELLAKSQAVFYYHLVKDDTGAIIPLLSSGDSTGNVSVDEAGSVEMGAKFKPCIDRFEEGLTFVGSAAEALKNKQEPLPALSAPGAADSHSRRPAAAQRSGDSGGWMSRRNKDFGLGAAGALRKHRPPNKSAATAPPPKETSLERFLKGQPKKATMSSTRGLNKQNSTNTALFPSNSTIINGQYKGRSSHFFGSSSLPVGNGKKALHSSMSSLNTSTANAWRRAKTNPFGPSASPTVGSAAKGAVVKPKEKLPLVPSSIRAIEKASASSPASLSPVKFDYGGYTPPPQGSVGGQTCSKPKSGEIHGSAMGEIRSSAMNAAKENLLSEPIELLDSDDDGDDGNRSPEGESHADTGLGRTGPRLPTINTSQVCDEIQHAYAGVTNDNIEFDYGIIPETPPRETTSEETAPSGLLSDYIQRTKSYDHDRGRLPRVSTSPPKRLSDDGESRLREDSDMVGGRDRTAMTANASNKRPRWNERGSHLPGSSQTSLVRSLPKRKESSVNKRPFKSPYPTKARITTSSSALLAGFARQEKLCGATSSFKWSNKSEKKRKSSFFHQA